MMQDGNRPAEGGPPEKSAGWLARLGEGFVCQRVRALWILAATGFVLFTVFRALLLVMSRQELAGVTTGEIVRCLTLGMRFDAFAMGIVVLPLALVLALAPDLAFALAWFRRAVTAYVAILVAAIALVETSGVYFFGQFGFRLNWMAIEYFQYPREVLTYIWNEYPVIWVFAGLGAAGAGLYWVLSRLLWSGRRPSGKVWPRPLYAVLLVSLCVLGIRGGLAKRPLSIGKAYDVSNNNVVGQLALNNVRTLVAAIRSGEADDRAEDSWYPFPPADRAATVARQLFYQAEDTDLAVPGNPLWRRTATGRPRADYNVVVILMEGQSGKPVGAMGHSPSYTPVLDALCREGLFFERMYAVGIRTKRAMVGVLCGHPDLGSRSVMEQSRAQGNFLTLPRILEDRGYGTVFVYGGRPEWDNTKGFFTGNGVDEFIGQNDGPAGQEVNPWGVADELTFQKAHERFVRYGDRPFFGAILTITNHEPFNYPRGRFEELPGDSAEVRKLNCYRYCDWALGEFFRKAREAPYFKKTIFVVVADHGRDFVLSRPIDVPGHRVPCVIYAPGIVTPGRVRAVAGQTDIPPTVLAMLGGEYEHCFFGRNLLKVREDDGFALFHGAERLGFVRGDRALVLAPRRVPFLFRLTADGQEEVNRGWAEPDAARLQEEMLSAYGVARRLYLTVQYRPPGRASPVPWP